MKHADVPMLVSLVNGEVDPEVEAHVRNCAKCQDLAAVVGLELEPPQPASVFTDGVYEDVRLIGMGGMGEVYLARDRRLQRQVVLKRPPRTSDGVRYLKLAARLEHERAVLARLNHPAIPPVFEGGQLGEDGEPFFAMPLAGVETLTSAVARLGTLEDRITLLPSMISVAEGVAYAHRRGVIHRDIKPDHVMLDVGGEARLVDWGLAKVLDEPSVLDEPVCPPESNGVGETRRGNLLATVQGLYTEGYSPPEQRQNAPAEKHFDVYALGATLFFLVTGRHPTGPLPERAAFPRGCPGDLMRIIQKAMHADPIERYPDAGELTLVLKKFQAGRLVHPSLAEVVEDWVRRHAVSLMMSALAGAALVAGLLLTQHRAQLEQTDARYRGKLERAQADARATAAESDELEEMYAHLERELRTLERASTATIADLTRRLGETRRERSRLAGLVGSYREECARLDDRWEVASAELERATETVLELRAERAKWEAEARRATDQLARREADLASLRQRLEAAAARGERQDQEMAELRRRVEGEQSAGSGPGPRGAGGRRVRRALDHPPTPDDLRRLMPELNVTPDVAAGPLRAR